MSNPINKLCRLLSRGGFPVHNATGQTRTLGKPIQKDDPPPSWAKPGTPDPPGMISTNWQPPVKADGKNFPTVKHKPVPKKVKRIGKRFSMFDILRRLRGDKNG